MPEDTPLTAGSVVALNEIDGAEFTGVAPLGTAGVVGGVESRSMTCGGDSADTFPTASTARTRYE